MCSPTACSAAIRSPCSSTRAGSTTPSCSRWRPSFIWMSQQDATFDLALENREAVARALSLTGADLWPAPIQPGSTGNKFLFVPLRDKATVDRAVLDVRAMLEAMGERPRMGIFVFAPDPDAAAGRVFSRTLGPHSAGIPEAPATGRAS